jgi:hypothetical protein
MVEAVNATGWELLVNGSLVKASYVMLNTSLGGSLVMWLFLLYQTMLYLKIRSPATNLITGLLYLGVYMNTEFFTWKYGWILAITCITFLTMVIYDLFIRNRTDA